jgi:hypothetical protein
MTNRVGIESAFDTCLFGEATEYLADCACRQRLTTPAYKYIIVINFGTDGEPITVRDILDPRTMQRTT